MFTIFNIELVQNLLLSLVMLNLTKTIDKTQIIKIIYKLDIVKNYTNTIYKLDNLLCTGLLGANLKCNKCVKYIMYYGVVFYIYC